MYMIAKEVAKLNLAYCVLQEVRHRNTGNKIIQLNQDDIVVAIGIIINPIWLKNIMLIKIFNKTETKEIWNGNLVLCLAKKKLEKTFIKENAGKPSAK